MENRQRASEEVMKSSHKETEELTSLHQRGRFYSVS